MITSRDQSAWIIPGGGIEQNESMDDAAHRELYEEAGVKGRIVRDLGIFENCERKRRTNVFVIHVEQEYENWEEKVLFNRQRHWFQIKEVFSLLTCYKQSQLTFLETFIKTSPNSLHLSKALQHT